MVCYNAKKELAIFVLKNSHFKNSMKTNGKNTGKRKTLYLHFFDLVGNFKIEAYSLFAVS